MWPTDGPEGIQIERRIVLSLLILWFPYGLFTTNVAFNADLGGSFIFLDTKETSSDISYCYTESKKKLT